LSAQKIGVGVEQERFTGEGEEVAVRALLPAEGDMDIESRHKKSGELPPRSTFEGLWKARINHA
jgi:hypothetical protein